MRVIVVGAGVLGASAAWHLARAGAEVLVCDGAHEGRATAAGAGIICPWVSDATDQSFYRLYTAGGRYYETLVEHLEQDGKTDLGFRRNGALIVGDNPTEIAAYADELRQRRTQTPEMGQVEEMSPRDMRNLFPPLRDDLAGVFVTGGARVDGRRLTAAMLRAAQRHGATLWQGEAALDISGTTLIGVRVNGARIAADMVIVTAGVWAPALLADMGIALPVLPQRGQILHLRLPNQNTDDWPVILPPGSHYLLAFEDSRIVAGATRERDAGLDYRVTAAGQAELLLEALRIAPGLGTATVVETRVGFRPATADGRPLLGAVPGAPLLVGNGLGAAGLTIGPIAGRQLARLALGETAELDLRPFDPTRDMHAGWRGPELR